MIGQLVQERNKAWNERDLLRQRVEELEEYNVNLHEEFHALYNGIGLYAPPDCNTPGVSPSLSNGFEFKHDRLSGDDNVKVNLWR
jgi:hypothetical protein